MMLLPHCKLLIEQPTYWKHGAMWRGKVSSGKALATPTRRLMPSRLAQPAPQALLPAAPELPLHALHSPHTATLAAASCHTTTRQSAANLVVSGVEAAAAIGVSAQCKVRACWEVRGAAAVTGRRCYAAVPQGCQAAASRIGQQRMSRQHESEEVGGRALFRPWCETAHVAGNAVVNSPLRTSAPANPQPPSCWPTHTGSKSHAS